MSDHNFQSDQAAESSSRETLEDGYQHTRPFPWLSHIQAVPGDRFPQAPVPLIFESSIPPDNVETSPRSDAYFGANQSFVNQHPAYHPLWTEHPPYEQQMPPPPSSGPPYRTHPNLPATGSVDTYPDRSLPSPYPPFDDNEHPTGRSNGKRATFRTFSPRSITASVDEHLRTMANMRIGNAEQSFNLDFDDSDHSHRLFPPMPQDVVSQEFDPSAYRNSDILNAAGSSPGGNLTYVPQRDIPTQESQSPNPKKRRGRPPKNTTEPPNKRRRGQRGGWSKGMIIGPRSVLEPSEQFTKLYNAAMEAFVDQQDYKTAMEYVLQAIDCNPEIFAAHGLLAELYFATGDSDRALDVLITGAHGNPNDTDVWRKVADIILSNEHQDHQQQVSRAAYCFSAMLRKDGKDHEARYQRAQCNRELGNYNKALSDMNIILQDLPHNSSILAATSELLLEIGEFSRAREMYEEHFEHYRLHGLDEKNSFEWIDVAIYSDIMAQLEDTADAVSKLKNLARWKVGRQEETFWDKYPEDDREWDQDHEPRRVDATEFRSNVYPLESYGDAFPVDLRARLGILRLKQNLREEAEYHFEWLQPDDFGEDAPVHHFPDIFLQVAEALQDAKEHEQALRYYEALHTVGIDLGVDFWLGMAASSYICEKKDKAEEYYEQAMIVDPGSVEAHTQLSKLYFARGDREKALKFGHEGLKLAQDAIPETNKRKYEPRHLRVAREAAESALRNAYTLPTAPGKKRGKVPKELRYRRRRKPFTKIVLEDLEVELPKSAPKSARKATRPQEKIAKIKKFSNKANHYEEVQQLYQTLMNYEDDMRDGDEVARNTWMDCAQALIEDFRSQKVFYPAERHKLFAGYGSLSQQFTPSRTRSVSTTSLDNGRDVPLPSVESSVPTDYCGISFSSWLDIMLEYALLLANSPTLTSNTQKECYETIAAATDCNIFYHDSEAMLQIHVCWLACAMALNDEPTLFNTVLRWFMKEYSFCTDAYRLFSAINFLYEYPPDKSGKAGQMDKAIFRSGPSQKFIFRQLMSIDTLLPKDYNANGLEGPVPEFMRQPREELRRVGKEAGIISNSVDPSVAEVGELNRNGDDSDDAGSTARYSRDSHVGAKIKKGPEVRVFRPEEMDVVLFVLYAHIMMASNSFPNALSYLYRAYSLEPKNPVCLLSMALCYMHQLFKRQSENRHMYLLQGWAWFEEYAKARTEWAEREMRDAEVGDDELDMRLVVQREIHFNRARCWEMLGMADLAVRGYAKLLELPRPETEDEENNAETWTMETAYAMATIYASNGDAAKAREITEKYLVVE